MTAVYELVKRPTPVLSIMPQSCNLVFDLLASAGDGEGCSSLTMAEIGALTRKSRQTVWHALNRLIGARLLEIRERRTGRGNGNVYFIRTFATGRKSRKPASEKVFMSDRFLSSPQSVNPPTSKDSQKKQQTKASKDNVAPRSPGHAMFLTRDVLKSNSHLTEDEKQTILQAFGFAVFKRGYFDRFQQAPGIFHDSLHLLAQTRPPGLPRRGSPCRFFFSWLLGLLRSMAEKYRLGLAAVVEAIHAGDGSEKCKQGPQAREYVTMPLSELLKSMATEPEGEVVHRPERRLNRVARRRPTWSDRGLVPSWARQP